MPELTELTQAVEEVKKTFEDFKAAQDAALESKADKGTVDVVLLDKIEKMQNTMDAKSAILDTAATKAAAEAKAYEERMDELETALSRSDVPQVDAKESLELRRAVCEHLTIDSYQKARPIDIDPLDVDDIDVKAYQEYSRHYKTYIRKGEDAFNKALEGVEMKLLSVDRDPGGGYWVNPEMSSRIMTIVRESSPIREFATVENIATDSLELMVDEDQASSGWVTEQQSRPETDTPDIGKRIIFAHELYAEPRATQKLLDDAGFDVEGWLSRKVAEKFARDEATAFVSGSGVGQPRGFTTYPSGTSGATIEQVPSTDAGAVHEDGLFNLVYSVKSPYLARARFMAQRLTIRDLRKLKDGQSNYLWEPSYKVGEPPQIIGYPISQADDMAAVASGSLSIAFGDFAAAYTIVDRKGIRVLRDPYTAKPYIKLYTTKRVGGDVVNFEAIKLQKLSAS